MLNPLCFSALKKGNKSSLQLNSVSYGKRYASRKRDKGPDHPLTPPPPFKPPSYPCTTLRDGSQMPLLAAGVWKAEPEKLIEGLKTAFKAGIRHIDIASVYKNEREIGRAIRESELKRDEIYITGKLWNNRHRPERVQAAIKRTLEDMRQDYLDCFIMHWPVAWKLVPVMNECYPHDAEGKLINDEVPVNDTWEAMQDLVKKNLVRTLGVSNFTKPLLEDLIKNTSAVPVVHQMEIHPYLTNIDMINFNKEHNIQTMAYAPLGTISVFNKEEKNKEEYPPLLEDKTLVDIAQAHKRTVPQVILRWLVQKGIPVAPKSVRPERIQEVTKIFDFELSADDVSKIEGLNQNMRMVNPYWSPFQENYKPPTKDPKKR